MATKRLIVVFGATGAQGGSVARAILRNPSFSARGVTRSPDGKGAQELKKLGVEIVKGDLDDTYNLRTILSRAYGCFLVTNFWEHTDVNREIQQGKTVVDACKAAGVKHLIYSGLENTEGSGAAGPVLHFDGKGKVEDYIQSTGIPYTSTRLPFYNENMINFLLPKKIAKNKYAVSIPMADKFLYTMSVDDLGPCVVQILKEPAKYAGKRLGLAGDKLTIDQLCATLSKHLAPKQFQNTGVTHEQFAKLPFPGAEEMANMFHFYQLKEKDMRDVQLTRELNPKILSFDAWVQQNKDELNQVLQ